MSTEENTTIIDRKFVFVAQNPISKNEYSEYNAIILCAHDRAVPAALRAYKRECEALGCEPEHIESVRLLCERVCKFQVDNPTKIADTKGDELKRCIDGEGLGE